MGSFRDYIDVAGGLRSGLDDEPPWWARGAIAAFAAVVVLVMGVSAVLGVGAGPSPEAGGGPAPAASGPVVSAPAPRGASPPDAGGSSAGRPAGGAADDAAQGGGDTVALADRDGTFQQVPRAAVTAARGHGSRALGVPAAEVRHQLIRALPGRVELTISSLDGRRTIRVAVAETDGAWQAS